MNNQLQSFENAEFGKVRVVEIDGQPWFVGKDVSSALSYGNTRDAIYTHVDKEDRKILQKSESTTFEIPPRGLIIINESGLYSLILSSKLPGAKKFKRWITTTVIPAIRSNGAYITPDTLGQMMGNPEFAAALLCNLQKEQEQKEALLDLVEELAPKAAYCDMIIEAKGSVSVSIIAHDYGMTAVELNTLLHDLGIQYKVGGAWVLYQPYADKGYTKSQTYFVNEDTTATHTRWTQRGRLFIYEKLKGYGIVPLAEEYSVV